MSLFLSELTSASFALISFFWSAVLYNIYIDLTLTLS